MCLPLFQKREAVISTIKPCGCKQCYSARDAFTTEDGLDLMVNSMTGISFDVLCQPHAQEKKDQYDKFWQDVSDKRRAKYNANYDRKRHKELKMAQKLV